MAAAELHARVDEGAQLRDRCRDRRHPPTATHGDEGLQAALQIRAEHPDVGVLVLSQYVELGLALKLLSDSAESVGYLLNDRISEVEASWERCGAWPTAVRRWTRSSCRRCYRDSATTRMPPAKAQPPWGHEHRRPRPARPAPLEGRGLKPIGLHECRHTAATWLDAGVTPDLQERAREQLDAFLGQAVAEASPERGG
jgi:hypothetical protein